MVGWHMELPAGRPTDVLDRAKGALVGLALGDALGTTLEFARRDTEPPVTDLVGGGPFGLAAGEWTDDTSMALCLADSLLAAGGLDVRDLAERCCRWYEEGYNSVTGECFDIGVTTAQAGRRIRFAARSAAGNTAALRSRSKLTTLIDTSVWLRFLHREQNRTHCAPLDHGWPSAGKPFVVSELLLGGISAKNKTLLHSLSWCDPPSLTRGVVRLHSPTTISQELESAGSPGRLARKDESCGSARLE